MKLAGALFFSAIFLLSSAVARSQQSNSESVPQQPPRAIIAPPARDCGQSLNSVLQAQQAREPDRQALPVSANSSISPQNQAPDVAGGETHQDVQRNSVIRSQQETQSNPCMPLASENGTAQNAINPCSSEQMLSFQMTHDGEEVREIPIWHLPGNEAFFFEAGMTIDADGAPNAYHPDNTGLDDLMNAGAPGSWEGLAKDADGEPIVQGPNDPYPGYYISATALSDRSKALNDPARYVDASKIPYIVLPGFFARQIGARPGDFAVVLNQRNGKSSYAIFGDVGPSNRIGEGSVALAESLGIRSDARNGGTRRGILYLVFPGSGNGRPRTVDEINAETEKLLEAWGGNSQLTACTVTITEPAHLMEGRPKSTD